MSLSEAILIQYYCISASGLAEDGPFVRAGDLPHVIFRGAAHASATRTVGLINFKPQLKELVSKFV